MRLGRFMRNCEEDKIEYGHLRQRLWAGSGHRLFWSPLWSAPFHQQTQSFWRGTRDYTGSTVIVLGSDCKGRSVDLPNLMRAGQVESPYSRADERSDIFLCEEMHPPLPVLWPKISPGSYSEAVDTVCRNLGSDPPGTCSATTTDRCFGEAVAAACHS